MLQQSLSTMFQVAFNSYHIPILLNPTAAADSFEEQDESLIIAYLVESASCLMKPTKDEIIQRHRDIERFKNCLHHPASAQPTEEEEEGTAAEAVEDEINTDGFNSKDKSTTFTSTYTLQQLKITKTTTTKYSDGTEIPTDLEDFESRASTLLDKMNGLQHRLILIVPTRRARRSSAATNYSPSSLDSNSMEFFLTDDNTTTSTRNQNDKDRKSVV